MRLTLYLPADSVIGIGEQIKVGLTSRNRMPSIIELTPKDVPASVRKELRLATWNDQRPDLVFTPDGQFAAVAFGCDILIINCRSGRIVRMLSGHRSRISDFSFSIGLPHLAGISVDGTMLLWDWPQGITITSVVAQSAGRNRVAYSSDGSFLATAGEDAMRFWKVAAGEQHSTFSSRESSTDTIV